MRLAGLATQSGEKHRDETDPLALDDLAAEIFDPTVKPAGRVGLFAVLAVVRRHLLQQLQTQVVAGSP